MHSSVFEVSRKPIPESKRARAGHLPDWFYEQVCDYAENSDPCQQQEVIDQLHQNLGELCVLDGDSLTISRQIRENYFRKSYDYFKAAAKALAQTDYKTFAGKSGTSAFHLALDGLNDSYEVFAVSVTASAEALEALNVEADCISYVDVMYNAEAETYARKVGKAVSYIELPSKPDGAL